MSREAPRHHRAGWPWPAATQDTPIDEDALGQAQALVAIAAQSVIDLTEALRLALKRLEQAQGDAEVASACVAAREADEAIANARRHDH